MVHAKAVTGYRIAGLLITLVLPLLLPLFRLHFFETRSYDFLAKEGVIWLLYLALFLIMQYGEQERFSSLGFNTPVLPTLLIALLTLIMLFIAGFATALIYRYVFHGRQTREPITELLMRLPFLLKLLTVIRAGIVEETFFRGYGILKLQQLTGKKWRALTVPVLCFGFAHLAYGTVLHVVAALAFGIVFTAVYRRTKNLAAVIIAHTLFDALLLLVHWHR